MSGRFVLELIEQHWCEPYPEMDPSAGGRLRVIINGTTVMDGESDDIGIARSALAMSRTLVRDHTLDDPVAEQLVLHDGGFATTLMSCGVGANWWVRHVDGTVRIDGVVRFDRTYGAKPETGSPPSDLPEIARRVLHEPHEGVAFPEASCLVPYDDYAREVIGLAQAALDFAPGAEKQFLDDFYRSEWLGWQTEMRETLEAVAAKMETTTRGPLLSA